jgi:hypothetical protein
MHCLAVGGGGWHAGRPRLSGQVKTNKKQFIYCQALHTSLPVHVPVARFARYSCPCLVGNAAQVHKRNFHYNRLNKLPLFKNWHSRTLWQYSLYINDGFVKDK